MLHVDIGERTARELPAWMFDAELCAAMTGGDAQVSLSALLELRGVLDELLCPVGASTLPKRRVESGDALEAT